MLHVTRSFIKRHFCTNRRRVRTYTPADINKSSRAIFREFLPPTNVKGDSFVFSSADSPVKMSGNFLTIPGDDAIQRRSRSSSLTDLISAFDTKVKTHNDLQKVTAFSGQFDKTLKPTFSKDEYGKPIPGSMTELRGAEAQARVFSEMKELCEIIHDYGKTPCKSLLPPELKNATSVISFGELFSIYTVINDKLVGLLLRTRKYQLTHFEGEVLFQKRDDDVPVFLMESIDHIREYCNNKSLQARRSVSPMPT